MRKFELHNYTPTMQIRAGNYIAEFIRNFHVMDEERIPSQMVGALIACCQSLVDSLVTGTSNYSKDIAGPFDAISKAIGVEKPDSPRDVGSSFAKLMPSIAEANTYGKHRYVIVMELMKICKVLITVVDSNQSEEEFRSKIIEICTVCYDLATFPGDGFPEV